MVMSSRRPMARAAAEGELRDAESTAFDYELVSEFDLLVFLTSKNRACVVDPDQSVQAGIAFKRIADEPNAHRVYR